jgi:hypothetical protein
MVKYVILNLGQCLRDYEIAIFKHLMFWFFFHNCCFFSEYLHICILLYLMCINFKL